jgi:predicted lipoprotein with Yx(FWY)xxD motif
MQQAAQASAAGSVSIHAVPTNLGMVLADSSGRTLYMLTADNPKFSNCTTIPCTIIWPPVKASGGGIAAPGVQQSLLGTLRLPDGSTQVTYAGHPLYTYQGDSGADQTFGERVSSFGGIWYVLSAATGKVIT